MMWFRRKKSKPPLAGIPGSFVVYDNETRAFSKPINQGDVEILFEGRDPILVYVAWLRPRRYEFRCLVNGADVWVARDVVDGSCCAFAHKPILKYESKTAYYYDTQDGHYIELSDKNMIPKGTCHRAKLVIGSSE